MKTAYLALGSNLGDRSAHLRLGLEKLSAAGDVTVVRASSVFETTPVGVVDQPDFFNLAAEVQTSLAPPALLARALQIEAECGRVRRERWGPRVLDIDVLWYDDQSIATGELIVPHPRMLERAFVLIPLAEIAPRLVVEGQTIAARAAVVPDAGVRRVGSLVLGKIEEDGSRR